MNFQSTSLTVLKSFAGEILAQIKPDPKHATILALRGELGSGKTAFTQALAKTLGIKQSIISPTFVIAKKYSLPVGQTARNIGFKNLIHFDFYRLTEDDDLDTLNWKQLLAEPQNLIVVEWPERIEKKLPAWAKTIDFFHKNENERLIKVLWLKSLSKTN